MSHEDVLTDDQGRPDPVLPTLPWNYYWDIQVTTGPDCHVYVSLKRKWLNLFRTTISNKGYDSMILKAGEELTPERIQQVASIARNIYDHQFDQQYYITGLAKAFPGAKVRKR